MLLLDTQSVNEQTGMDSEDKQAVQEKINYIKALICYNLAVVNYAELTDYLEREEQEPNALDYSSNPAMLEQLNKMQRESDLKKKEE